MRFSSKLMLSVVAACFLLLSAPLYAAITGIVSGTVTDASGAAIPKANVVVRNEATGITFTGKTDNRGFYSFNALDVGTYSITTTVSGFQTGKVTGIKVDANSNIKNDISLKVGSVDVTEQVTSNPVQIETQNTQLGEVIESERIVAVPLNGRSYTDLLALQPGVSPYKATSEGSNSSTSGGLNPGNQSVNGGREASNGFMVNGGNVNDGLENGAAIIPVLDSISEFRIITSNFDAEYGNYSGGQVNVVTKSGTNQIHGEAFEFFRNTSLNATNYFATPATPKPQFNQNIFGGILGAPIRKDHAFFFGDFQATKRTEGSPVNVTVPTAANLAGNLGDRAQDFDDAYNNGVGVAGVGWANVLSNRLGYAVAQNEPYYFQGCTNTSQCVFPNAVIPKAAFSPAAVGLSKYIPTPNNVTNTSNYSSALSTKVTDYKGAGRVDLNTRFGQLFGYYFLDDDTVVDPYTDSSLPGFGGTTGGRAQMGNLGLTTVFKNNTVNSFRFTYTRSAINLGNPAQSGTTLASLGFTTPWGPTGGIDVVNPNLAGVPNISLSNVSFGNPIATNVRVNNTFQWLDNYMMVLGKHTMQFGVNYHYDQINGRNNYAVNGQFDFSGGNETGVDTADFLLGAPGDFVQATQQLLDSRSHYAAGYVQDSWRVLPNFTMNYGVRYEVTTPWYDTQNKLETIVPGQQSIVFPGAPKGWVFPGDPGVPRTLAPIKWNKFAPRFGFAYVPPFLNGKTSIRGGYGLFYTSFQDQSGFVEIGDAPYGLYWESPVPVMLEKPYTDRATQSVQAQKFPFVFPPTNVGPSNPDNNVPWASYLPLSSSYAVATTNTVPYNQNYFIGFQQDLGRATVMTMNYVGNVGRHLANAVEANPGDPALCLSLQGAALAPGETDCGPNLETQPYTRANGTVVAGTRPTLGLAFASNPYLKTSAKANYNSLQMDVKHTSTIWDVLFAYTFSRSFDNSSSQTESTYVYRPEASYGLSRFDVTHNFVGSYNVRLPFGRMVDNRFAKAVVGGWSISGITRFASGLPVSLSENDDHSLTGTGADRPNYTGASIAGDHNPRNRNAYFNIAAFPREAIGEFGSSHRRFFHGPGINNTDLAILRDIHLHEANVVQLRIEAFNAFNHAQFNNPSGSRTSGNFGQVTSAQDARVFQIAAKYRF
jgi:hypothetical protein